MNRITAEGVLRFEKFVNEVMNEGEAAGLAVAIVNSKGETYYEKCFGLRDKNQNLPVNTDTVFGLASVTKSFTCLAIMQLAEKGVIDIHAPVSKYLPYYKAEGISVAHLMFHSGGYFPQKRMLIGALAEEMGISGVDLAFHPGLADEAAKRVAARLDGVTEHTGAPGENFSYCNDGYAMLSAIVKDYGGETSYSDYLAKYILQPLGMSRSGCDFLLTEKFDNVTKLYKHRDGVLAETDDYTDNAFVLMGGGGMKSTINDMKKYICMYLNMGKASSGGRIAEYGTIKEMIRPRIVNGLNTYYAFGLRMKPMDDIRVLEHSGGLTGVSSNLSFSYEADAGVMVLCNTSAVGTGQIADAAMKMLRGKEYNPDAVEYLPFEWSPDKMKAVCGEYVSGEGASVSICLTDGELYLKSEKEDRKAVPVNPYMLCAQGKNAKQLINVFFGENGEVWAIGQGSRMVPRKK